MGKFFALIILGVSVFGFGSPTNDALMLALRGPGLELLAKELKDNHLQPIKDEALPDYNEEVGSGVKVKTEGMHYSADFGALVLNPRNGYMEVGLDIQHVKVHVGKARFTKKIIVNISSTCKNTTVSVDGGRLTGKLVLDAKGGNLSLTAPEISFPIADQNYKVDGPEKCSGFLIGGLIRSFVHSTLEKSRSTIERQLNEKLRGMIPKLSKRLNQMVKKEIPISVNKVYPFSAKRLRLKTWPHKVKTTKEGLHFVLGIGVNTGREMSRGFEFKVDRATGLGELGVNPELINAVFREGIKEVPEWQELSEKEVSGIGEVLKADQMATIWPDLSTLELSSNRLRLFVGFESAPRFELAKRSGKLKAHFPLKLQFQIQQAGSWHPYFELNLQVSLSTVFEIKEGLLSIALDDDIEVLASGDWYPEYAEEAGLFEQDVAEIVFASLFEYLYATGPVVELKLPEFELGGKSVFFDAVRIKKPYLIVKLLAS